MTKWLCVLSGTCYANSLLQQRFVNQAEENRTANEASYEAWIKQYTPLQVKQANTARKHLRRLGHSKYNNLQDERLVKSPVTTYMWFVAERFDSGDFKNTPLKEAGQRIAAEWKGMTESEKQVSFSSPLLYSGMIMERIDADHQYQPYFEKSARDIERYREEYREVYGEDVPPPKATASSP